jgi:hypothetical protein
VSSLKKKIIIRRKNITTTFHRKKKKKGSSELFFRRVFRISWTLERPALEAVTTVMLEIVLPTPDPYVCIYIKSEHPWVARTAHDFGDTFQEACYPEIQSVRIRRRTSIFISFSFDPTSWYPSSIYGGKNKNKDRSFVCICRETLCYS